MTEWPYRERAGRGAVTVMTHGLGDDGSTWDGLLAQLTRSRATLVWDLPGHRHSAEPPTPYTPSLGVDLLDELVQGVGEPVDLIGHSLGGYLSLTVALRRPDLVRSITIVSSGPGYRDPVARERWNRYVAKAVTAMSVAPSAAGLAQQHDSWVIDNVSTLAPPLLVLVGESDTGYHAGGVFLARTVPESTIQHIPGAGHHPQRTHPDVVATAVLDHLERSRPRLGESCR